MSALESPAILEDGQWVLRGARRQWQPNPPRKRLRSIHHPITIPTPPGLSAVLCDCGCLIARGEDCPACRVWARGSERAGNLASFRRAA